MFLSGLIGSSITFLLILISKLIKINNRRIINHFKNESITFISILVKMLLWLLYISLLSSLIAGIWIINTLNILGNTINI